MKRDIFYIMIMAAVALVFSACSKELTEPATPASDGNMVTLFGSYPSRDGAGVNPSTEGDTKTSISGNSAKWSTGDEIGVFTASSKTPAKFSLSSGAGTTSGSFTGKLGAEAADEIYVLYPYATDPYDSGFDVVPTAAKLYFNGQTQDGFGAKAEAHLGKFAYMASSPVKLSDGKAELSFHHLAVKMAFEFSLPETATVKFLTMVTTLGKFYDTGVVDLTSATPVAKGWGTAKRSFSLGFKNSKVEAGQKVTAYAMMLPVNLASSEVTFYVAAEKADGTPVTYCVKKSNGLKFEAAKAYTAEVPSMTRQKVYDGMVFVPGGSLNICGIFTSDDDAANKAIVEKDYRVDSFWIGRTEVTNQQYCDFLNGRQPAEYQIGAWISEGVCQIEDKGDGFTQSWVPKSGPILNADGKTTHVGSYADYPMIGVTGLGANAYAAYVAEQKSGFPVIEDAAWYLPTEAQWEYAAVGSEWNADWANELIAGCHYEADYNKYMWSCRNCDSEGSCCLGAYVGNGTDPNAISGSGSLNGGSHPVAKLLPNYLGIYDMSGNVGEICSDYYNSEYYPYGSSLNPRNSSYSNAEDTGEAGYARVVRGGMWFSFPSEGITYSRDVMGQSASYDFTGFRMALPLK